MTATDTPRGNRQSVAFLGSIRALLVGDGLSGMWACEILRSLGADVARLAEPGSTVDAVDPLNEALGTASTVLQSKTVDDAIDVFDPHVVLCDRVSTVPSSVPFDLAAYRAHVDGLTRPIWVTISATGLSGPHAGTLASDLTLSALSGVLMYVKDGDGGHRPLPGEQTLMAAGQAAALAALHGLDRRNLGQVRVHMDVSAQEATIATGPALQCAQKLLHFSRGGTRRFGPPYGPFKCADGFIYIGAAEQHHWEGVAQVMGFPEVAQTIQGAQARVQNAQRIEKLVQGWTASRNKRECESALQAEGVPATAINSLDDVLQTPQFAFRHQWDEVLIDDVHASVMDSPWYLANATPNGSGGDVAVSTQSSLRDLKVAEASHILAASVAGAILGAMGASVTKIEDPQRLDFFRRSGPFIDGIHGDEWSGYFAVANHSKTSCVCLQREDIDRVVAGADVVLENWGRGRAKRAAIDSASVSLRFPAKLAVSCSGFGHSGPQSNYRVLAYNLNAYCGLITLLTGDSDSLPSLDFAWADWVTAFSLATVIAAWCVGSACSGTRRGAALDVSMAEVVVQRLNGLLLRHQLQRDDDRVLAWRNGSGGAYVLPTDDGTRYVAISTPTLRDETRVVDELRELATRGEHGAIGSSPNAEELARFTIGVDGLGLVRHLIAKGVDAAVALTADDLVADAHLTERGFFTEVEHPEWGRRRLVGLPWRFDGEGPIQLGTPPRLDEGCDR